MNFMPKGSVAFRPPQARRRSMRGERVARQLVREGIIELPRHRYYLIENAISMVFPVPRQTRADGGFYDYIIF
jgi:hypothetical protein